jgi:recombination protein RecA
MAHRLRPRRVPTTHRAALAAVVAALRRRYGAHIIRAASDLTASGPATGTPLLSTGSLGLDLVTGGLVRGGIAEYAGVDGAGKETLAHTALARAQRDGGLALLLDADGASDPDALAAAGVDLAALPLACPTTAQEAWPVLVALARSGALDLFLVTSLSGLLDLPGAGDLRLLRVWLPRLRLALRGRRTALLVTNAPLARDGADRARAWDTVGGPVVAQAASLRVTLRPTGLHFGPHGDVVGLGATATVVKHHGLWRGPSLALELTDGGTSQARELVTLGLLTGRITDTRLGLVAEGIALGRTEIRAAATLATDPDPDLAAALEARIRRAWGVTTISGRLVDGAAR